MQEEGREKHKERINNKILINYYYKGSRSKSLLYISEENRINKIQDTKPKWKRDDIFTRKN